MLTQLRAPDHYGVINDGVVSVDDERHDHRPSNNTHRSLRQLVAIAAWFRRLPGDGANFSFHANASFSEERISGGESSNVTFKLAVRKCEVVFLAPSRRYFRIARSSIRFQNPLSPSTVQTTATSSAKLPAEERSRILWQTTCAKFFLEAEARGDTTRSEASVEEILGELEQYVNAVEQSGQDVGRTPRAGQGYITRKFPCAPVHGHGARRYRPRRSSAPPCRSS